MAVRKVKTSSNTCIVHAWSSCGTVSSVFGKESTKLLENVTDKKCQQLSEVISSPWSNQAEVADASIEAFTSLYEGRKGTTLAKLR